MGQRRMVKEKNSKRGRKCNNCCSACITSIVLHHEEIHYSMGLSPKVCILLPNVSQIIIMRHLFLALITPHIIDSFMHGYSIVITPY